MKVLISIDDTDNLESIGTGKLAHAFSQEIVSKGWGQTGAISRHQLFVHPDIPYTSHNSTMCFPVTVADGCLKKIIKFGQEFLRKNSAEGSDPGFCVAIVDEIKNTDTLIQFGKKAKKNVLTKEEAYNTAKEMGIHLSEHGGTGGGVIGALAGIGLRLTGNDGRIRGKYFEGRKNEIMTVDEIISQTDIQEIREENGERLKANERILLGEKVKSVPLQGKIVLLVEPVKHAQKIETKWQTLSREKIKQY